MDREGVEACCCHDTSLRGERSRIIAFDDFRDDVSFTVTPESAKRLSGVLFDVNRKKTQLTAGCRLIALISYINRV
jgi:hypothetical protein